MRFVLSHVRKIFYGDNGHCGVNHKGISITPQKRVCTCVYSVYMNMGLYLGYDFDKNHLVPNFETVGFGRIL